MVTGLASNLDLDIGGIGTLAATAQGTADASASSVTGSTDASALQQSVGIASGLDMDTSSDAAVSSNSTIVGGADASSTSGATSMADMTFNAQGIQSIDLNAGGIGTLSTNANVTGDALHQASAVHPQPLATSMPSASTMAPSTALLTEAFSGTGVIDGGVSAVSTGGASIATGDFDATGIGGPSMVVGGVLDLTGQAQTTADVSAESVDGTATATSVFQHQRHRGRRLEWLQ